MVDVRKHAAVALDLLGKVAPSMVGLGCIALVVAGVWAEFGRGWGLIAAGLPGAAFYLLGEWRSLNRGEG